jgi:hypothetical protein
LEIVMGEISCQKASGPIGVRDHFNAWQEECVRVKSLDASDFLEIRLHPHAEDRGILRDLHAEWEKAIVNSEEKVLGQKDRFNPLILRKRYEVLE